MSYVIKAFGPVSASHVIIDGQYVKHYSPEAFDGRGDATFTNDITQAMQFSSLSEAWDYSRKVPECRRFRADGKPNRPLTAFTLEYVSIPGEK